MIKQLIVFVSFLSLVALRAAADEPWQFKTVDEPLEIVLGQEVKGEFLDKSKGFDVPLVGRLGNYSTSTMFPAGSRVRVVARSMAGTPGFILDAEDGGRYVTGYDIPEADRVLPRRYANWGYIHYASDTVVGLNMEDVRKLWGEYVLCNPMAAENDGNAVYYYPQIQYVFDDYATSGTKLYVDSAGIVAQVQSILEPHRNLFGKLPGFKSILNMNMLERVRKPYWLDEPVRINRDPGFFSALFFGLLWLVLLAVVTSLVILCLHFIIKCFYRNRSYTPLLFIYGLMMLAMMYPALITLLQYYHNAWLVLILFVPACFIPPMMVIGISVNQCPKCKSTNLESESVQDTDRIMVVNYPSITATRDESGQLDFKITRRKRTETPMLDIVTCKDCGHRQITRTLKKTEELVDNCPGCGRHIDDSFWRVSYTVVDGKIHLTYIEDCPACHYHYETPELTTDLPKVPSSRPPSRRRAPDYYPYPQRYLTNSEYPYGPTCKNCACFDSEYCNVRGRVGNGYRVPANKIEEPWRTFCEGWRS